MIQTYGLSHIQIVVRDLERSLRFYQDVFGMKELFRVGANAVMLQTPGTNEVFTLSSRPEAQGDAGKLAGVQHFGFRLREKADMKVLLEEIERAGGKPLEHGTRGQDKEEVWAFFSDPDGYDIEVFWAPHD
jgi:catechol 2,3-dioxygenase-like lactoylglutathione lyase family enzyme